MFVLFFIWNLLHKRTTWHGVIRKQDGKGERDIEKLVLKSLILTLETKAI